MKYIHISVYIATYVTYMCSGINVFADENNAQTPQVVVANNVATNSLPAGNVNDNKAKNNIDDKQEDSLQTDNGNTNATNDKNNTNKENYLDRPKLSTIQSDINQQINDNKLSKQLEQNNNKKDIDNANQKHEKTDDINVKNDDSSHKIDITNKNKEETKNVNTDAVITKPTSSITEALPVADDKKKEDIDLTANGKTQNDKNITPQPNNNDMPPTNANNVMNNEKIQDVVLREVKIQDDNIEKEIEKNIHERQEKIENEVKKELQKEEQKEKQELPKNANLPSDLLMANTLATNKESINENNDKNKVIINDKMDNAVLSNETKNTNIDISKNTASNNAPLELTKPQPEKNESSANRISNTTSNSNQFKIATDVLFTKFDTKKALNFDYHSIKYDNFGFLENADELKWIKQTIAEQHDPTLKKKREEQEKKQQELQNKMKQFEKPIEPILRVLSLVYFNDNDWRAKVNRDKVDNKTAGRKEFFGVKPIKANKTSMIFLMQKPDEKIANKVRLIKNNRSSYSGNYYLVSNKGKTYVAFKLFIGQKINLDTMQITG